jgi:PP-loop superfamily ATP-utilizing enzyme
LAVIDCSAPPTQNGAKMNARKSVSETLDEALGAKNAACREVLGNTYVTLDLEGFRSGSMNDVITIRKPK